MKTRYGAGLLAALLLLANTGCGSSPPPPADFTKAPERYKLILQLNAPPSAVWDYVKDHQNTVALSGGMVHTVRLDNTKAEVDGQKGCLRTCELKMPGPDGKLMETAVVEEVVFFSDESMTYYYALQDTNFMGLKNHLGVFRVSQHEGGKRSRLEWLAHFDHPQAEQMAKQFAGFAKPMTAALLKQFGGRRLD